MLGFSALHLNARSLAGNFDKFNMLLSSIEHTFSVIGVSETWLNDSNFDLVNIPGYRFISTNSRPVADVMNHVSCLATTRSAENKPFFIELQSRFLLLHQLFVGVVCLAITNSAFLAMQGHGMKRKYVYRV